MRPNSDRKNHSDGDHEDDDRHRRDGHDVPIGNRNRISEVDAADNVDDDDDDVGEEVEEEDDDDDGNDDDGDVVNPGEANNDESKVSAEDDEDIDDDGDNEDGEISLQNDENEDDDGDDEQSENDGNTDGEDHNDDVDDDDDKEEGKEEDDENKVAGKGKVSEKARHPTRTSVSDMQGRYHTPKMFQDAVTVVIPLDVTADLKIAIQHTRSKRIKSILKKFPSLKQDSKKQQDNDNRIAVTNSADDDGDALVDDEDDENGKDNPRGEQHRPATSNNKKKKTMDHIPRPEQYGSVLDYLEAKYVKGVMLDEDDEDGPILDDDKSEGQGSVYSKDSFLDDTDLQRDVAEQVMASTTLTKLELEEEDGDFFVNVGNLEVENDEYGDHYDPLQDKENQTTKKRKKPSSSSGGPTGMSATTTNTNTTPLSKKTKVEDQPTSTSAKSKMSTASATSVATKKTVKSDGGKTPTTEASKGGNKANAELVSIAKKAKGRSDALFKKAVAIIKKLGEDDLPRRKTKLKVALTCPANKKPGDDITFTNPHNPGQRLRVKVPKDCLPGGTFKVTVPVKQPDGDSDIDNNKIPRELQDVLDDYARAYDEWCTAQSKVDTSFETFKEKQGKYDKVAKEFPTNLVTLVTGDYLKQVVRRCRQNKYKRGKTAAARQQPRSTPVVKEEKTVNSEEEDGEEEEEEEEGEANGGDEEEEEEEDREDKPRERIVHIPAMGRVFPSRVWDTQDFTIS